MYVITEEESYEYEYPIGITTTFEEAQKKALLFLSERSAMIDYFNIYKIEETIKQYPSAVATLSRDKVFKDSNGNRI